ncbi:hypothetical protein GCM10007977_030980 [Dactylosporangium sucinum]|uniref:Uncharacterized protein n=1 Tax=Dactylosporangium sucinum TaxID=1424081 RepID=A0A917WTK7_9ACTN|nr:hypothetical protein GCM10007977_030980 [Dactylosporangium sucinum]
MGIVSMVETPPYPIALRGKRFAVERAVTDVGGLAFRITVRTAKSPISMRKGDLAGELFPLNSNGRPDHFAVRHRGISPAGGERVDHQQSATVLAQ